MARCRAFVSLLAACCLFLVAGTPAATAQVRGARSEDGQQLGRTGAHAAALPAHATPRAGHQRHVPQQRHVDAVLGIGAAPGLARSRAGARAAAPRAADASTSPSQARGPPSVV